MSRYYRSFLEESGTIYPASLKLFIDAGNPLSYSGTGTTVTDLIGTQNGTLTNGVVYSSLDGGSFVFDGINDYITFGTNAAIKPTASGTVSIMVKFTGSPTYEGTPFANDGGTFRNGIEIFQDVGNGRPTYYVSSASSANSQYFASTLLGNTWNLLTLTWDGTNIKTYNNGVLFNTRSQTITITSNAAYSTVIGANNTSAGYPMKGNISYLKIYDGAIDQAQITTDFNEIKTRYGL